MFQTLLEKLARREDLSAAESAEAMAAIMDGTVSDAALAGFLIALAMKGEQPAEIVGLARTMRERAVPLSKTYPDAVDLCGTGGDRSCTFNVSSVASIVVAGCGVRVAKHGNRSVSSRCGSADRLRRPRCACGNDPGTRRADAGRGRNGVPLRPGLPSLDASRGRGAPRARPAHGVQPAGAADQSGPAALADRRRSAARAHGD